MDGVSLVPLVRARPTAGQPGGDRTATGTQSGRDRIATRPASGPDSMATPSEPGRDPMATRSKPGRNPSATRSASDGNPVAGDAPVSYAESRFGELHFGWRPLRSLRDGDLEVHRQPRPGTVSADGRRRRAREPPRRARGHGRGHGDASSGLDSAPRRRRRCCRGRRSRSVRTPAQPRLCQRPPHVVRTRRSGSASTRCELRGVREGVQRRARRARDRARVRCGTRDSAGSRTNSRSRSSPINISRARSPRGRATQRRDRRD